jgi:hypothetical protein
MGLWLRALLLRDAEVRRRLSAQLNGGKLGFNRDEAGVVQAACELAVRQRWVAEYDVRDITDAVSFMREANLAKGKTPYGQLEMEAVIRSALGEAHVDTNGIPRPLAFEIQIAATGYVAANLSWQAPEIDRLLVEAEDVAFGRGWDPPLAA